MQQIGRNLLTCYNKITSPRACVLLFRRRKSFIFISCSSDWLYANEFVLGVRNCRGKKNFAPRAGTILHFEPEKNSFWCTFWAKITRIWFPPNTKGQDDNIELWACRFRYIHLNNERASASGNYLYFHVPKVICEGAKRPSRGRVYPLSQGRDIFAFGARKKQFLMHVFGAKIRRVRRGGVQGVETPPPPFGDDFFFFFFFFFFCLSPRRSTEGTHVALPTQSTLMALRKKSGTCETTPFIKSCVR